MPLPRLRPEGEHFVEEDSGRTVILRGVNLGGNCKLPIGGETHKYTDFSDHRTVNFVGRPFPLSEAEEHFGRLRHWGFNCLRLLCTWEAIEHAGPGLYDTEFLDFFTKIVEIAGEFGFYVYIDFHQDCWSRMSGGDGAPGWVFEKLGVDFTTFTDAGVTLLMQEALDTSSPNPVQASYPPMCWSQNYKYFSNTYPWTLFYGGADFAQNFFIDGVQVQTYLQQHFLGCVTEVGKRIKDMPHVLGFDSLNEPSAGWIGKAMDDCHMTSDKASDPVMPGLALSPVDSLRISHGFTVRITVLELSYWRGGFFPGQGVDVNTKKQSVWLPSRTDPFQNEGVWKLEADGSYTILKPDHFRVVPGKGVVDFEEHYLFPFICTLGESIQAINPKWMVFAEKTGTGFLDAQFPKTVPRNVVNATHFYDGPTLHMKKFFPFSIDPMSRKFVIGDRKIQDMFTRMISNIKKASEDVGPNGCPTIIGEFGIPFDLHNGSAYEQWAKGRRSCGVWDSHVHLFDFLINSMDACLLSFTLWNYCSTNRNSLFIGDGWNQEDLSIFSRDQQDDVDDPNSGGRAVHGFARAWVRTTQGFLRSMMFERNSGVLSAMYSCNPKARGPTEVFVPLLQYPNGYEFAVKKAGQPAGRAYQKSAGVTVREGAGIEVRFGEHSVVEVHMDGEAVGDGDESFDVCIEVTRLPGPTPIDHKYSIFQRVVAMFH